MSQNDVFWPLSNVQVIYGEKLPCLSPETGERSPPVLGMDVRAAPELGQSIGGESYWSRQNPDTHRDLGLVLFRIEPLRAGLPSFSVRWDRDDDTVDIDLEGQPRDRAAFARPSPRFKGHKTSKVSDNPRTYKIDIKIPTSNVFKGTITLRGLGFGVRLQDGLSLAAGFQCEAEVIRSTPHNDAPGPPDPIKPN
jgi:hypothetical protein